MEMHTRISLKYKQIKIVNIQNFFNLLLLNHPLPTFYYPIHKTKNKLSPIAEKALYAVKKIIQLYLSIYLEN